MSAGADDVAGALLDALRPGSGIGVAVHDEQLRTLLISPSLAELSGTEPEAQLGRRLTGLAAPVDLKAMDWVSRAVELRTPTLIIHSVDDEYVPYGPSAPVPADVASEEGVR